MKFFLSSKDFLSVVSKLQGVIMKKVTIQLLANLLIKTNSNSITITGTDLMVIVSIECDADIEEEGEITLSAKKLFEIARELPEGLVSFEKDDKDWVTISCEQTVFKLIGMPADTYPVLDITEEKLYLIPRDILQVMFSRTEFAISVEGSRVAFTGGQFVKEDNMLKMISTDGHRLVIIKREYVGEMDDFDIIIPKKTVREVLHLLEGDEGGVSFGYTDSKVIFKFGRTTVISNLVEGKFPNMEQVIKNVDLEGNTLGFNRSQFLVSIRRVAIFSESNSYGIRLDLEKDFVRILSNDPQLGEAKEELEISYDGEPLSIGFNSRYLLEVLSSMDTEDVEMKISNPKSSVLILDTLDDKFSCLLMPMSLK